MGQGGAGSIIGTGYYTGGSGGGGGVVGGGGGGAANWENGGLHTGGAGGGGSSKGPEGAVYKTGARQGDGAVTFTTDPAWGPDCKAPEPGPRPGKPRLTIAKRADAKRVRPHGVVGYTVTIKNPTKATAGGVKVTDDLKDVIDDAVLQVETLKASSGSASYRRPVVTWRGDIKPGGTVTLTYKVRATRYGNGRLDNLVTGPAGSNCAPGSRDPRCRTRVLLRGKDKRIVQ
ncbi:hypothetical protein ACIBF1_20195 [Spirillospora sp. NPDC050679]